MDRVDLIAKCHSILFGVLWRCRFRLYGSIRSLRQERNGCGACVCGGYGGWRVREGGGRGGRGNGGRVEGWKGGERGKREEKGWEGRERD